MKHELHIHSTDSDGSFSKEELLKIANDMKLDYIAFTDHNTVDNLNVEKLNKRYKEKYKEEQMTTIIPSIEIDVYDDDKYHLLGYNIIFYDGMKKILQKIQTENHEICLEVLELLRKNDGIEINVEDILRQQKSPYLSKSSIINYLVYLGICEDYRYASYLYVGRKSKNYIPRKTLTLQNASELIIESGGIPVLAHPYRRILLNPLFDLRNHIEHYKNLGIVGIEAKNPSHSIKHEFYVKEVCKENNMIYTGGSDYHSGNTYVIGNDENELIDGLLDKIKKRGR